MKKYGLAIFVLCVSINYEIFAQKEFTNYDIKNGKKYLGGFVNCIEYGPTEVPGLIEVPKNLTEHKVEHRLVRDKKTGTLVLVSRSKNNYNICSRNFFSVNDFIFALKEEESKELCHLGYELKSISLMVFPKENYDNPLIDQVNKDVGCIEKKQKAIIDSGEIVIVHGPCTILKVDVKDKSTSNQELGYVASRILEAGKNTEFITERYSIKAMVLEEKKLDEKKIDIHSLFSEEQE